MPNYVGFQYDFAIQNTREDICSTEVSYKCMFLDSPYDKLSQYIASSQVVKQACLFCWKAMAESTVRWFVVFVRWDSTAHKIREYGLYKFFEWWSRLEMFEFDLEKIYVKKKRSMRTHFSIRDHQYNYKWRVISYLSVQGTQKSKKEPLKKV